MIRAAAGNAASLPTSSPDYTLSGFFTPTSGSDSAGFVRWVGYNGIPTIASPGLGFYNCAWQFWQDLYFYASGNSFTTEGVISGSGGKCVALRVVLNMNNQASIRGLNWASGEITNCRVYGGTASPSSSSGAYGIYLTNFGNVVQGCRVDHCRDHGIYDDGEATTILNNEIHDNVGDGIYSSADGTTAPSLYAGNTINNNQGHGIELAGTNGAAWTCPRNNCITNQAQSGKAGISVATSTSDKRKRGWGWNNVWNNATDYHNVTADATDLSVDPGYANASTGDFTPSTTSLRGAALPTTFP